MADKKADKKTDINNDRKTARRNTILNIVIVILTFILFCFVIAVVINTKPRVGTLYGPASANSMIRVLEMGRYNEVLQDKYSNIMQGTTEESNSEYAIPYAVAGYYEAAVNYNGYLAAGNDTGAAPFKKAMDGSRDALGDYAYIADDIDDLLAAATTYNP